MTGNNNRIENITLMNEGILVLNIDSKSSGILAIELPRKLIDSKPYISSNPPDSRFTVLIDDRQLKLQDVKEAIKNNYIRTLKFPFEPGSNIIEIIGTESLRGDMLKGDMLTLEEFKSDVMAQAEASKKTPDRAYLLIYSDVSWSANILDSGFDSYTQDGSKNSKIEFECVPGLMGIYSLNVQKQSEAGHLFLAIVQNGNILDSVGTSRLVHHNR